MAHYKLAFLGFGNVGQALARLLLRKESELKSQSEITFSVTGIATGRHGAAIEPNGLDLERCLEVIKSGGYLDGRDQGEKPADALDFIRRCSAEVLFENTPVNYQTGQPAIDHLRAALEAGMHAITANKGPVAHAYQQLSQLAALQGRKFYFESTVMDGAPIFSLFRGSLPAARLKAFRGILNSTTNLILTRMEVGESLEDAIAYAQSIGIAETDPSGDVDGWDAAIKVSALVTVLMGIPLTPYQVDREGIRKITIDDINHAIDEGKRWKLVCSAQRDGSGVKARVAPEMVPATSSMYNVEGTSNILIFNIDTLGQFSIAEYHSSIQTTAYGLLADFINAVKDS